MCRLDVIWDGYCHNSMDHLVEETKAGINPSLLKGSPTENNIDSEHKRDYKRLLSICEAEILRVTVKII